MLGAIEADTVTHWALPSSASSRSKSSTSRVAVIERSTSPPTHSGVCASMIEATFTLGPLRAASN